MTVLDELHRRLPADRIQSGAKVVAAYGQDRAAIHRVQRHLFNPGRAR